MVERESRSKKREGSKNQVHIKVAFYLGIRTKQVKPKASQERRIMMKDLKGDSALGIGTSKECIEWN